MLHLQAKRCTQAVRQNATPAHVLAQKPLRRAAASWAAAMAAHARSGRYAAALTVFRRVLAAHPLAAADEFAYSAVLRCCSRSHRGGRRLGRQIHAQMWRRGFESNLVLGCSLLEFYSKRSDLGAARKLFDEMPSKDAVSYTVMMSALVEAGDRRQALSLYPAMIRNKTVPTEYTFAKLLTVCGSLRLCREGRQLHAQLLRWEVEFNVVLKTALVDMYCKCGQMGCAERAFRFTAESDVMLWTAMVVGYSQDGHFEAAVAMFHEMECAGVVPNAFTYAGLISACSSVLALETARQVHARLFKFGLEHDVSVCNALVDLYSKSSSCLRDLLHSFEAINTPNVVSWTALVAGLAFHGQEQEAFAAFAKMRASGLQPNSFTVSTLLKGCSSLETLLQARKIHAYVLKTSFDSLDDSVGNSLVDIYARFGRLDDAWAVGSAMAFIRDRFTYTSLAKGLNQIGLQRKSLEIVARMVREEVAMDGFSLSCFLSAAASLAAIESGKQLHCCSVKLGLSSGVSVSNSLIDMYSKCRCMEEARNVFMGIKKPNVVSWNGLISGLAFNGRTMEALSFFEDMTLAGGRPDGITFSIVLHTCKCAGFVDIGVKHFNSMRDLGITPQREHYACFLDMLARAGRLEEAACTIENMPFLPDLSLYKSLLAACKLHNNLVLGENTAMKALGLDSSDPVIYTLLADIYDAAGKLHWGEQVRRMRRDAVIQAQVNADAPSISFCEPSP